MAVKAKINKLPVLVTDDDVNHNPPNEIDVEEWEVEFTVRQAMESCCGVLELGNATARRGYEEIEEGLPDDAQSAMVERLREIPLEHDACGLAIYTLTDNQTVEREALLDAGFQEMAVFLNPNTQNRVTMYGLLMNQPRQSPVSKKKPVRR